LVIYHDVDSVGGIEGKDARRGYFPVCHSSILLDGFCHKDNTRHFTEKIRLDVTFFAPEPLSC